jgi:Zn-dependent protease with chaperone function
MLNPNSNETAVWICLGVIIGAPFFFKTWLDQVRPVLAHEVQKKTTLLSWIIFIALFTGGFAFNSASSSLGGALLFAAIISFSILFQIAGRYQLSMNRAEPRSLTREKASLRQTAGRFAVGAALCAILSKFSLAVIFLPFAIPFLMPLFIRLQHSCTPMADSMLKLEIINQFKNEGVMLENILIVDQAGSDTKNAFIAGTGFGIGPFGRTLFVTLGLFRALEREEFQAVMLHEAAHLKLNHAPKRILSAIFLTVIAAFWTTLPATFLFHGNPIAVGASILLAVVLQAYLMSRTISRQEHEADLAAVAMGASSNALIAALQKVAGNREETENPILRVLGGNLYPSTRSRIDSIRQCEVPTHLNGARSRSRAPALAYSLLVVGVVFWAADHTVNPAKVSRSAQAIAGR